MAVSSPPPPLAQDPANQASSILATLPSLKSSPLHHPDCCLSLSTALIEYTAAKIYESIGVHVNNPGLEKRTIPTATDGVDNTEARKLVVVGATVLSIGSGTGLFEALLLDYFSNQRHHSSTSRLASNPLRGPQDAQRPSDLEGELNGASVGLSEVTKPDRALLNNGDSAVSTSYGTSRLCKAGNLTTVASRSHGDEANTHRRYADDATTEINIDITVLGVEVPTNTTKYLPPSNLISVNGTWDILNPQDLQTQPSTLTCSSDTQFAPEREHDGTAFTTNTSTTSPSSQQAFNRKTKHHHLILTFIYPPQPRLFERYLHEYSVITSRRPTDRASASAGHIDTHNQRGSGDTTETTMVIWAGPRADWADYEEIFAGVSGAGDGGWKVDVKWGKEVGVGEGEVVAVARRTVKEA